jgi:hypothetical protein
VSRPAPRAPLTHREGDMRAFRAVTDAVYDRASPYVAPFRPDLRRFLDPRANPLFAEHGAGTFYTAHRDGRPVGRIVAHVHHASNARHGERRAAFGYFDVADDPEAARLLLELAGDFARRAGCDTLAGNFNLTAMQQCGVLTAGFEHAPYTDQHYNPPHVPALLEGCGFRRTFPMTTFELDLRGFDPEAHCAPAARERLADPALRWATLRAADFPGVLEDVRVVLNDGFDRNPMFVPLTPAEMHFQAKDMARILDPRIAALVRDREGPVGTVVCVPDLNPFLRATRSRVSLATPFHYLRHRLRRRRAVIVFYSVVRRWHGRGVNGAMLYRVTRALVDAGYESLGITWIGDDNGASLRQMTRLGARPLHHLHLFERAVDG